MTVMRLGYQVFSLLQQREHHDERSNDLCNLAQGTAG